MFSSTVFLYALDLDGVCKFVPALPPLKLIFKEL